MKQCIKCGEVKPLTEYFYARTTKDKRRGDCNKCGVKYAVTRKRLKVLGVSPERYIQMNVEQKGLCAICNKIDRFGKDLSIDHCHKTGKIRGLLCSACNPAIGAFEDDVERLLRAAAYLQRSYDAQPTVPGFDKILRKL